MKIKRTLILQHLHRTGGTTLYSVMRRYFDTGATHRIDEFRDAEKYSIEYFSRFSQEKRDSVLFLRGHMPFGLHSYFSHPCDYVTVVRDPVERVLSEYTRLAMWRPDAMKIFRSQERLSGVSLEDFVSDDFAAVNNYQTRILSGRWAGRYEKVLPIDRDVLETAKGNLTKYFKVVGTTDRLDETILVLAKMFGWRNPYYLEKKQLAKRKGIIPQESSNIREAIKERNKFDAELYRFAGEMLDESILKYGSNFPRDLRRFRRINNLLGSFLNFSRLLPSFLRKPAKLILHPTNYENLLS